MLSTYCRIGYFIATACRNRQDRRGLKERRGYVHHTLVPQLVTPEKKAIHLPDVLRVLNINRSQLTVLGVVSKNDYNRNIHSLGSATNFSIIKELKGEGNVQYTYARSFCSF